MRDLHGRQCKVFKDVQMYRLDTIMLRIELYISLETQSGSNRRLT
jgi:hypothetical protein